MLVLPTVIEAEPQQPTPLVLPTRAIPVPAAHGALDQTLNSSLHAIREPVRPGPLLFRLGVDHRNNSVKSTTSLLNPVSKLLHAAVCVS